MGLVEDNFFPPELRIDILRWKFSKQVTHLYFTFDVMSSQNKIFPLKCQDSDFYNRHKNESSTQAKNVNGGQRTRIDENM